MEGYDWAVDPTLLLNIAAIFLGSVGVLFAISGVFAFLQLRRTARREARKAARELAENVAERAAVRYLQAELPNIVREYRELAGNAATYDEADDIAEGEEER